MTRSVTEILARPFKADDILDSSAREAGIQRKAWGVSPRISQEDHQARGAGGRPHGYQMSKDQFIHHEIEHALVWFVAVARCAG